MTTRVATQAASGTDLVDIGERLGLYEAISEAAVTAADLAWRVGVPVLFVRDWLTEQATKGYLAHDAATGRYATWCAWPRR